MLCFPISNHGVWSRAAGWDQEVPSCIGTSCVTLGAYWSSLSILTSKMMTSAQVTFCFFQDLRWSSFRINIRIKGGKSIASLHSVAPRVFTIPAICHSSAHCTCSTIFNSHNIPTDIENEMQDKTCPDSHHMYKVRPRCIPRLTNLRISSLNHCIISGNSVTSLVPTLLSRSET